jgi:hypothetical protein
LEIILTRILPALGQKSVGLLVIEFQGSRTRDSFAGQKNATLYAAILKNTANHGGFQKNFIQ